MGSRRRAIAEMRLLTMLSFINNAIRVQILYACCKLQTLDRCKLCHPQPMVPSTRSKDPAPVHMRPFSTPLVGRAIDFFYH